MLRLRIENFDRLPDGGPLEYMVDRRGFDFGRDQHLDWTLPDKNRVVSGKHCEIRFHDNAYWLTDISTNGTFLNRSSKRMQSPYRLNNGDTLSVGEYVLSVAIDLPQQPGANHAAPGRDVSRPVLPDRSAASIWDAPQEAPPIDARELLARPPEADRAPEILYRAANIPPIHEPEPVRKPRPAAPPLPPAAGLWTTGGEAVVPALLSEPPPAAPMAAQPPPAAAPSEPRLEQPPVVPPAPAGDFVRRFAAGARIPQEVFARMDAGDIAELSGQLLHLACQHIMALLQARAEAKALSRTGRRTMIQSTDNNPLKFMATPEEALRVMLSPHTRGYLDAKRAIESAFADLNMHQIATLAAMQSAVTQLFDEISPDAIAKSAEGKKSLLKSGKSQQWDTFSEIWAAKAGRGEHGMLGAFLDLFAEQYDRLSKNKP